MSISTKMKITALACAAGLGITAPAWAFTAGSFTYSAAKTGYLSISPLGFIPDSSGTVSRGFENKWGAGELTGDNACFNAEVNLPQGAKITSFRFVYKGSVSISLVTTDIVTGARTDLWNETAAAVAARTVADHPIVPPAIVNNAATFYGIALCTDNLQAAFGGARITYTYTKAGD